MSVGTLAFDWVLIEIMKSRLSLCAALILGAGIAVICQQPCSTSPSKTRIGKAKQPLTISCSWCAEHPILLAKPEYPSAARFVNVSGSVSVQVLINQTGSVQCAEVLSGHPLLRSASIKAAMLAKFPITYVSGKPVRVYTTLVYNFVR